MSDITRRDFVKVTGSGLALASLSGFIPGLMGCAGGKELQTGYFGRFGIDSETIRKVLSEALVYGGDYADIFFQHSDLGQFENQKKQKYHALQSLYIPIQHQGL